MIFSILDEISSETVNLLIAFLNELEGDPKKPQKIEILLSSNGGEMEHGNTILYLISERKNKVKLTAYGKIHSAAFEFYTLAECEKTILPNTIGMYHRASNEITMTSGNTPKTSEDAAILKSLIADEAITKKVCELANMSDQAKADIFADKDVYFTYDELKEMFKIAA